MIKQPPKDRERAKPGSKGGGEYFRIIVRPKDSFVTFRYHDVGDPGHIQRLAGKRENGRWATQAWLISKEDAHVEHGELMPTTKDARELLAELGSKPEHYQGDIFKAKDRKAKKKQS